MRLIRLIPIVNVLATGIVTLLPGEKIFAQAPSQQVKDGVDAIGGGSSPDLESTLVTGIDVFLYVIGAIAVIMIIYGGFKYITSAGDASALTSAKNTIMYAVIGLVVTVLAGFIASFAVNMFSQSSELPPECVEAENQTSPGFRC